jgi:hypothetical protein
VSEETIASSQSETTAPTRHQWYRVGLVATLIVVLITIVMMPLAIRSMQEVLGRASDPLFDLVTGLPVDKATAAAAEADATYVNLGLVGFDEDTGLVTIAVSGNRNCGDACPALTLTLMALDDDADQRRGLPPSATLNLAPEDLVFSDSVQLPMRGQPSLYPFDEYKLWLGTGGAATLPNGTKLELTTEMITSDAVVTVQNRVPDMVMGQPVPLAPNSVQSATDPFDFASVLALTLDRPFYLKTLAVLLVLFIAISAGMALFTRGINELALGVGGLILGVWGVRSVLMPQALSTATAIDLALTWVILLLLLGLVIRVGVQFYRRSELPTPAIRRLRK